MTNFLAEWSWRLLLWIGVVSKRANILVLGLDNAGKTTLLHMLKNNKIPGCVEKMQIVCEETICLNKLVCR
jgi:GTP-binding protein SAR1